MANKSRKNSSIKRQTNIQRDAQLWLEILNFLEVEITQLTPQNFSKKAPDFWKCMKCLQFPDQLDQYLYPVFKIRVEALSKPLSMVSKRFRSDPSFQTFLNEFTSKVEDARTSLLQSSLEPTKYTKTDLLYSLFFEIQNIEYIKQFFNYDSTLVNSRNGLDQSLTQQVLCYFLEHMDEGALQPDEIVYYQQVTQMLFAHPKLDLSLKEESQLKKIILDKKNKIERGPFNLSNKQNWLKILDALQSALKQRKQTHSRKAICFLINPPSFSKELERDALKRKGIHGKPFYDGTKQLVLSIDDYSTQVYEDAFSIQKRANGTYQLAVYVTDVADRLYLNDILIEEAMKRGSIQSYSVKGQPTYKPMFPYLFAKDICALKAGQKNYAIAHIFEFDSDFDLLAPPSLERVLICPAMNCKYNQFNQLLDQKNDSAQSIMARQLLDCADKWGGVSFKKSPASAVVESLIKNTNYKMMEFFQSKAVPCIYETSYNGIIPSLAGSTLIEQNPDRLVSLEQIFLGERMNKYYSLVPSVENQRQKQFYGPCTAPLRNFISYANQCLSIGVIDGHDKHEWWIKTMKEFAEQACNRVNGLQSASSNPQNKEPGGYQLSKKTKFIS